MSWKILFAVLLVAMLYILYINDTGARAKVSAVTSQVRGMVMPEPVAPTVQAVVAEPEPEQKKEGFCPKLMQRYGFCDAGESMQNNPARGSVWDNRLTRGASALGRLGRENLTGGDPASNTVWQGYMKSSVLPY
jgi:hypothetical protein